MSLTEKIVQAALAARFCALGYYVGTNLEFHERYELLADVAGIKPVIRELKKRARLGPAPAGVLSWLDHEAWTPTDTVIRNTGGDPDFARGVLLESEEKGWVEKRVVAEDSVEWRLQDYQYPGREAFIAICGSPDPARAFEHLKTLSPCCNLAYLALDYEVDPDFMDRCFQEGFGLMMYVPRNGYFKELLPPESREIKDRSGFMSLCERILFENYVLRRDEWI